MSAFRRPHTSLNTSREILLELVGPMGRCTWEEALKFVFPNAKDVDDLIHKALPTIIDTLRKKDLVTGPQTKPLFKSFSKGLDTDKLNEREYFAPFSEIWPKVVEVGVPLVRKKFKPLTEFHYSGDISPNSSSTTKNATRPDGYLRLTPVVGAAESWFNICLPTEFKRKLTKDGRAKVRPLFILFLPY